MAHHRAAGRLAVVLAILSVALGACSGNEAKTPTAEVKSPPRSGSTKDTSAAPGPTPQGDAALATWKRYVEASLSWDNPPNPGDPRIPQLLAPSSVENLRVGLAEERAKRMARRPSSAGPPTHVTAVEMADSDFVTLRDCWVNDLVAYRFDTGEVVDDGVSTLTSRVEIVRDADEWKVKTIEPVSTVPGRRSCPA